MDGTLVDPNCMTNVAMEEFLYSHGLVQDFYDHSDMMIKTHNGAFINTFGKISLLVTVFEKSVEQLFDVVPLFDLFRIKLGHPWLKAMKVVPSMIHNYVKFPLNGQVHTIPCNRYKPLVTR